MKQFVLILFALVSLNSCNQDNGGHDLIDPNNDIAINNFEYLIGQWRITESCATNGPICYEHPANDTISFDKNQNLMNGLIYKWFFDNQYFVDNFNCDIIGDSLYGEGLYTTSVQLNDGSKLDTTLSSVLEIIFREDKSINLRLKLEVYHPEINEYLIGDVSNFYAEKIK